MKWSFIIKRTYKMTYVRQLTSTMFLGVLFLTAPAVTADTPYSISMACEIAGCSIKCKSTREEWVIIAEKVQSVVMTTHESGVVNFLLNKGVHGKETLVVGPDGFMCKVDGQK